MKSASGYNIKMVKLGWTRCYLLKCTGGYLLIDVYYPGYYAKFEKKLVKKGIATSEIKYVLLTHHHDDHAGFAAELVRCTGCRVIAHRNALSALEKGRYEGTAKPFNRRVRIALSCYTLYCKLQNKDFTFPPVRLTDRDIVIDGDNDEILKEIGIDGVILHTPGHTSTGDSISVLLSDGSAFVGDIAMNFLRWTGIGNRPIFIDNVNTVYKSWLKLRQRGAKVIYPSHGNCFSATKLDKLAGLAISN